MAFALSRSDGAGGVICGCNYCANLPDELTLVLSGLAACDCVSGGGQSAKVTALSINGAHTLTRINDTTWENTNAGSFTESAYDFADCDPVNFLSSFDSVFTMQAFCEGDGAFTIAVNPNITGAFAAAVFGGAGVIGEAITNGATCGPPAQGIGGGSATLSE